MTISRRAAKAIAYFCALSPEIAWFYRYEYELTLRPGFDTAANHVCAEFKGRSAPRFKIGHTCPTYPSKFG